MFYVYKMLPSRRLEVCRDNSGRAIPFSDKQTAYDRAAALSLQHPYPYTIDRNPNLHGTVDGKADTMDPKVTYSV